MGGPPAGDFFFAAARSNPEELVQVIGHVAIVATLGQKVEIFLNQ
jgi:hypothetical protein